MNKRFLVGLPITLLIFPLSFYYFQIVKLFLDDWLLSVLEDMGKVTQSIFGLFSLLFTFVVLLVVYVSSMNIGQYVLSKVSRNNI